MSYYSGLEVDYNMNGMGYKAVRTPYMSPFENEGKRNGLCLYTGGNPTEVDEKVGYLNFFPTEEQMEKYTLGDLVTSEVRVLTYHLQRECSSYSYFHTFTPPNCATARNTISRCNTRSLARLV